MYVSLKLRQLNCLKRIMEKEWLSEIVIRHTYLKGLVGMSFMGLAKPINDQRWVLEPMFLQKIPYKLGTFWHC